MRVQKTWHEKHRETLSFGGRIADAVANGMGSWRFIIIQTILVVLWMGLNLVGFIYHWDVYPFILLNLFLSMLAAIQAPVIMMSQNRQDVKDRLRSELDFDVNRRAEVEIKSLTHQLRILIDKVEDVEELAREAAGRKAESEGCGGAGDEKL